MSLSAVLEPFRRNLFSNCPGGPCHLIQDYSEVFLALLITEGLVFLATLVPPLFSWSKRKPDGKKRVFFAVLACLTFYFWLAFLVFNSVYCFGFLAHEGPCRNFNRTAFADPEDHLAVQTNLTQEDVVASGLSAELPLSVSTVAVNESCGSPETAHGADLKNVALINCLIVVVLLVVLVANAREALNAKALHYVETLCRKEDVQKFLSAMVAKPPEVGHHVSCFHATKPTINNNDQKVSSSCSTRKVTTFSAIENFEFQTWRDFSDLRLIDPSHTYPIIEVEVVLNFFPGDHFTAERYKAFVMQLTKKHSDKDAKINIDDYFHLEDHREWTFFIGGDPAFLSPWWDRGFAKVLVGCLLLFAWPFRLGYNGQIAKHQVEVKKAVFCENSSQDEGVSLQSATPGSSGGGDNSPPTKAPAAQEEEPVMVSTSTSPLLHLHQPQQLLLHQEHQQLPQLYNQQQQQLYNHPQQQLPPQSLDVAANSSRLQHHQQQQYYSVPPTSRAVPLTSPRTHLRETTKDIVTAVTHQDVNGMSTINTIALKDIDVQMSALSGYETYV